MDVANRPCRARAFSVCCGSCSLDSNRHHDEGRAVPVSRDWCGPRKNQTTVAFDSLHSNWHADERPAGALRTGGRDLKTERTRSVGHVLEVERLAERGSSRLSRTGRRPVHDGDRHRLAAHEVELRAEIRTGIDPLAAIVEHKVHGRDDCAIFHFLHGAVLEGDQPEAGGRWLAVFGLDCTTGSARRAGLLAVASRPPTSPRLAMR